MPLNLLKHKSWNVYSRAAIDRVKQDEERAKNEAHTKSHDRINKLRDQQGIRKVPISQKRHAADSKNNKAKTRDSIDLEPWYTKKKQNQDSRADMRLSNKSIVNEDPLATITRGLTMTRQVRNNKLGMRKVEHKP